MEFHVDQQTAQALWDASCAAERAALTFFHDGKVFQFQIGMRAIEVRRNNPREYALCGQSHTVILNLVQLQAPVEFDMKSDADTSIRDAVNANR